MSASAENNDEVFARRCVERIDQVTCSRLDLPGQDGRVDYCIDYPGEPAALEITRLTNPKSREIASSLEATPIVAQPERFAWILTLEPGASLRNARRHVPQLIKLCEAAGLRDPSLLADDEDPAVQWSAAGNVQLRGYSTVRPPALRIVPPSVGGVVKSWALAGLTSSVDQVFTTHLITRKVRKLENSGFRERHLFLLVDPNGLDVGAFYGLSVDQRTPSDPLSPPDSISHVWLASGFKLGGVLRWSRADGWSRHWPFDDS